jgi:hypothetical protein
MRLYQTLLTPHPLAPGYLIIDQDVTCRTLLDPRDLATVLNALEPHQPDLILLSGADPVTLQVAAQLYMRHGTPILAPAGTPLPLARALLPGSRISLGSGIVITAEEADHGLHYPLPALPEFLPGGTTLHR